MYAVWVCVYIQTPPELPYGNYIGGGGPSGANFDNLQFSQRYPEEFKAWFLEQTKHPENADFKNDPKKWEPLYWHGKGPGHHGGHGDDHGHGHDGHDDSGIPHGATVIYANKY